MLVIAVTCVPLVAALVWDVLMPMTHCPQLISSCYLDNKHLTGTGTQLG